LEKTHSSFNPNEAVENIDRIIPAVITNEKDENIKKFILLDAILLSSGI